MNNYNNRVKQYYDQMSAKSNHLINVCDADNSNYVVIVIFHDNKKVFGCTSTFCQSNSDAIKAASDFFQSEDEFRQSVAKNLNIDLKNASTSIVITKNNNKNIFGDFIA